MNIGYRKTASSLTLRGQRRMARRMGIAALAMLRSLPLDVVASLGRFTKHCAALALLAAAMISRTPSPVRAEFGEISEDGDAFTVSAGFAARTSPAVAMDADGNFVAVWEGYASSGDDDGVFARRYDANGDAQGEEFGVNTTTMYEQLAPDVAMDDDGNFVVVWQSEGQDGSGDGIYVQRFDASGDAQGVEFLVNTETNNDQVNPEVAMSADGDFVVVWQSEGQDSGTYGIYAQRYDASGDAQGAEFRVNTTSGGAQTKPDIAMNDDGDFAVVWQSDGQDGSGDGVYMQRYSANGDEQGAETLVNTETDDDQEDARIAMDTDGNFVVVWAGDVSSGYDSVLAQRFDASGTPQGDEFEVPNIDNLYADNTAVAVAMDSDGDFVIAWAANGYPEGSSDYYHIAARRYNANGEAVADATLIKSIPYDYYTSLDRPAVAIDPDGANHVIVWEEYDYYDYGAERKIVGQRFVSPVAEVEVPDDDTESLGESVSIGLSGGGGGSADSKNFVNGKGLQASINIRNTKPVLIRLGAIIIRVPASFGNIKLTSSSIFASSPSKVSSSAAAGRATQHSHATASQVSAAQSVESDEDTLYIYDVDLAPGETYNFEFGADAMDGAPQTATVAITVKSGGDEFTQRLKLSQSSDDGGGDSGCALDAGSSRGRFALPFAGALFALLGGWYARRRRRA